MCLLSVLRILYPFSGPLYKLPQQSPVKKKYRYRFDGAWPRLPLPHKWTFLGVTGLTVDKDDVVWVLHRPNDLNQSQNYATLTICEFVDLSYLNRQSPFPA
jgi:hypothetical protein